MHTSLGRPIRADEPYSERDAKTAAVPDGPGDLVSVFNARALHWGQKHEDQNLIVDVYNGNVPAEYEDLFHPRQRVYLINMTRLSIDDLAGIAGQEMTLYSAPGSEANDEHRKAERRETICYGYGAAGRKRGGIDMRGLSLVHGFQMVAMAECVGMVLYDYKRRTPYFTHRDPRTHFAPIGWNSWEQSDLNGTMFAYKMSLGEIKRRYPDAIPELNTAYGGKTFGFGAFDGGRQNTGWTDIIDDGSGNDEDDRRFLWVGEYYLDDAWYVATMEDKTVTLLASEQGDPNHPGVCPVVAGGLYNPEMARSLVLDQIDIQFGNSRLYSQQLEFNDRVLYPPMFGDEITGGKVKTGPYAYNTFVNDGSGKRPSFHQAGPPQSIQTQQMMQFGLGLMERFNRTPEVLQGGGDANSAKALMEKKASVSSTIENHVWPVFHQMHPQMYSKAMYIDVNIDGNEEKYISGRTPTTHPKKRDAPVSTKYRPARDLVGYEDSIEIEAGIVLRGVHGRTELMQLRGVGLSKKTYFEQLDIVRDPEGEIRRLDIEALEEIIKADLAKKAEGNLLHPKALMELLGLMAKKGEDFITAIEKLDEQGLLLAPPMPQPGAPAMPGMPAAAPDPAAIAEALSGAPSLESLQSMPMPA